MAVLQANKSSLSVLHMEVYQMILSDIKHAEHTEIKTLTTLHKKEIHVEIQKLMTVFLHRTHLCMFRTQMLVDWILVQLPLKTLPSQKLHCNNTVLQTGKILTK